MCDLSGAIPLNRDYKSRKESLEKRIQRMKLNEAENWEVPSYWVDGIGNNACLEYMKDKHMMPAYEAGLFRPMYDPAERRFVFPIRDEWGKAVAAVGRALDPKVKPKALNYNKSYSTPFMCGKGEVGVLVEDCASAVAASRDPKVTGVALLGTTLRNDFILSLTKFKEVCIALDKDAYSKSFKIKRHLTTYLKNVTVLRLDADIKDSPEFMR
jgi:hypothetical protein